MQERLIRAKEKVGAALRSGREGIQGMRKPLEAYSLEQFMDLVNRNSGSEVTLYPSAHSERYTSSISDGLTGELLRYETGYNMCYKTYWDGRTLAGRRVSFEEYHMRSSPYAWEFDEEKNRQKWFRSAVATAGVKHQEYPEISFLVSGCDGLQPYRYYLEKLTK